MLRLELVLEQDEDGRGEPGWSAYCPQLCHRGAASSGRTITAALRNLGQAIELVLEDLAEDGSEVKLG